jgi:PAS domain-containing protein
MFDHAGKLLVVNRRFHEMFGVPEGALFVGMTYSEVTDCNTALGNVNADICEGFASYERSC